MGKLIDADALIAEIKKRKKDFEDYKSHFKRFNSHLIPDVEAKIEECDYMLSFIDSMQEESVSEDLEKEIDNYLSYCLAVKFPTTDEKSIKADIRYIARHFANWQKEQMMKEAFVFKYEHHIACCLASECLRNHGWFNRERSFNELWKYISGVKELFNGEFNIDKKNKVIVVKEEEKIWNM